MEPMKKAHKDFNSLMARVPLSSTKQSMCHANFNLEQAEKFLAWFCRLPLSTTIVVAFKGWADSKDFGPSDRKAIFSHVRELLDAAINGPFDSKISAALDELIAAEENT